MYGPYCFYRTSVILHCSLNSTPHIGRTACTESLYLNSTAIDLLQLWTVQILQGFNAFNLQIYFHSPYGLYRFYRSSVAVHYNYTSTKRFARTARRVFQILKVLSACTVELKFYNSHGPYGSYRTSFSVQYSYNSTTSLDRTSCIVPQFLYSTFKIQLPYGTTDFKESLFFYIIYKSLLPYWPYCQYCASGLYITAKTLFHLWAVQNLQSISVCRVQKVL